MATDRPLVTIVTIVKDDARGLRATLDSVAAQRWCDFEQIVVDGASRDATVDVIRSRMDYELWLRVLPRYRFDFIEEELVNFVPGGVSSREREFFQEELAANRLHLRHARLENLRVRARRRLHQALRRAGLFEAYRAFRLRTSRDA